MNLPAPADSSAFFVVGITHVDLAWKRGRAEMSEMLEIVVIRLLDLLDKDPTFHYHLEQAAHFRELSRRRPDLLARLTPHLRNGRLEFVGGMASTLESNLPNGECFVRNLHMGLEWVRETWGDDAPVKTGWLVDTFGIPPQVPQILAGFGIQHLLANRFGGAHTHDLFRAHGLDGTEITVAGWGSYAAHMRPENVAERFCKNWDDIDLVFAKADTLTGPGPFLVIPYTENEMLVSDYPQTLTRRRGDERPSQHWQSATPGEFFAALEAVQQKTGRVLPVVDSDLNPEFTGCFSLRHPIRLINRRVENRLLEAEKWAALSGGSAALLEDAWWELAFVQFHDVFTGSHPTVVFHEVLRLLGEIDDAAQASLDDSFARLIPSNDDAAKSDGAVSAVLFNGLPWERTDTAEIALPSGWQGVARVTDHDGAACAFVVENGVVRVRATIPATGYTDLRLEAAAAKPLPKSVEPAETAVLENEWIRAEFDRTHGIGKLVWKPTGAILLENADGWLVAQCDYGNFQIENPAGAEVAAATGTLHLATETTPLGQAVYLSGEFPALSWAGPDSHLRWKAAFTLPADAPELHLALHLDWKGEATRIRLTLPTPIDSSTGIFEVPFGVARRKPYSPRTNAKGEWPAHRFVALEDGRHGVALVNTGVGGVEVSGGTLYTTLLRTPHGEYAGMVVDATSSQHGNHDYRFVVVPYAGSWADAGVLKAAQEANSPLLSTVRSAADQSASVVRLEPANVVLSGIKPAGDGSGDIMVRVYETAGRETQGTLRVSGEGAPNRFGICDLREHTGSEVAVGEVGVLRFSLTPFQIKTFRLSLPAATVAWQRG